MAGLSDIQVIETLDDYGFTNRERAPWRGEDPDAWTAYPIDVASLPDFARDDRSDDIVQAPNDSQPIWGAIGNQIDAIAARPQRLPPPGPVDALAWYLPFHYYGPEWGIFIKESEVLRLAGYIKQRMGRGPTHPQEAAQLCRVALSILYLHEAFHHKIESFATRLEIARLSPVYLRYDEQVYQGLLGTDDVLEEAIACSEMLTRLRDEKSFHGNVPPRVKSAAITFLREWIPSLPPGYRRGTTRGIAAELGVLMSQVAHGQPVSTQPAADWEIANHMIRGLFNKNVVAHVVVPVGATPMIPWLDAARYLSLSTKRVERHITRDFGYVDTGRGKGSHHHYHCRGRAPITLPANRESLSPGVQGQVAKALGYKNIRELAAKC